MKRKLLTLLVTAMCLSAFGQGEGTIFTATEPPDEAILQRLLYDHSYVHIPAFSPPLPTKKNKVLNWCRGLDGSTYYLIIQSPDADVDLNWSNLDYSKLYWSVAKQKKDGEVKLFDLKIDSGFISSVQINAAANGLLFTGFYSKKKGEDLLGVFTLTMDTSGKIVNENTKNLDPTFRFGKVKEPGGAVTVWLMNIGKVMPLSDGGFVWIAEPESRFSSWFSSKYSSYTDLIESELDWSEVCVRINKDLSIGYVTKIPKLADKKDFTLYPLDNAVIVNDVLYAIFNDHKDNLNVTDQTKLKRASYWHVASGKQVLEIARIEQDGSYKKEIIPVSRPEWGFTITNLQRMGSNVVLVTGEKSNDAHDVQKLKVTLH